VVWEGTLPHEPAFQDHGILLRECRDKASALSDAVMNALLADLRAFADSIGPRVRVGMEAVYEGRPEVVVRGADPETLLKGVLPIVGKHKAHLGVWKRLGARGSELIEVVSCPK
jgi:hypothetical protein